MLVRFADFVADLSTGELRRTGEPIRIQDLPFRLLAALVSQPGVLVNRGDLGRALWGDDTFVDFDAGLNTAVAKLREALDDRAESPRFIETVPKRGYRFIGQVEVVTPDPASEPHSGASPVRPAAAAVTPGASASRRVELVAIVAASIVMTGLAAVAFRAPAAPSRVAVALFDNETGRGELDERAQTLTDATVVALTGNPALAVIGNASVLRTPRPFRDLVAIRDTLRADFIVIGQLQQIDGHVVAITHLIRGADQVHLWVERTPMDGVSETAFENTITEHVRAAVSRAAMK
jgi:DNA-binding winged helix-turn-helix (wHTH) protein/TolB-like protein